MSINVLFVATALNRNKKISDYDDEIPNLIDENGNISEDVSNLDENFQEYFNLIKSIIPYHTIKFTTIDPAYTNEKKNNIDNMNNMDNINYMGHISTLLEDISLCEYKNFFDCTC